MPDRARPAPAATISPPNRGKARSATDCTSDDVAGAAARRVGAAAQATPCPAFPREVLQLAIAYRLQAKMHGDLPAATLRQLRDGASASSTPRLKPGTRLLRSWNGRTIAVTVAEDGYRFEDRSYRSLSAVAREVTGTAWSGPRFFGLREVPHG